jgi:NitT/TauT family transport system ATP-binding protein
MRILAGLHVPSSGQAMLDNTPIIAPSRRVGVMFQDANLMPWRTVRDNIALPLELVGIEKNKSRELSHQLLLRLGLSLEFADAYPSELSGGMAQRVALGRVLIQKPDLLLLDEPFGSLDSLTREQISLDLLEVWALDHQTVIMVTHDIDEAVLMADRILVFSRRPGQIIADIPVLLPRPRRIAESYNESFGMIARRVREAIHNT